MEYKTFKTKIEAAFKSNGYQNYLDENKVKKLFDFSCMLVDTNKEYNLTAITDEDGIILKHILDSATICDLIPHKSSMIDVGCGAGFPSLPVAILREDVRVFSVDSTEKKIKFIDKVCSELGIANIYPVTGRAEDLVKSLRESFDVATSRAVARLNILDELCLPFVKIGGKFIAMKSSRGEEELFEANLGVTRLGGAFEKKIVIDLALNKECIKREIFVFNKIARTPEHYPRNYSQMLKKPL